MSAVTAAARSCSVQCQKRPRDGAVPSFAVWLNSRLLSRPLSSALFYICILLCSRDIVQSPRLGTAAEEEFIKLYESKLANQDGQVAGTPGHY